MYTVNRTVVIARGKEPYLKWVQNLPYPTEITLEELNRECTVYLLGNSEFMDEVEDLIKENFITIFENELNDWWTDPEDWPDTTDYEVFREWFDVEVHSMLRDLEED